MAACLAYVDLNPIRAGIAETPETSRFTSVYERIKALGHVFPGTTVETNEPAQIGNPERPATVHDSETEVTVEQAQQSPADWLSPFELTEANAAATVPRARVSNKGCLPMSFAEYLQLLDWTGRELRNDKRGSIPSDLAPILERLQIGEEGWMQLIGQFRRLFRRAAGRPQSMQKEREQRGCRVMQGIRHSRAVFV